MFRKSRAAIAAALPITRICDGEHCECHTTAETLDRECTSLAHKLMELARKLIAARRERDEARAEASLQRTKREHTDQLLAENLVETADLRETVEKLFTANCELALDRDHLAGYGTATTYLVTDGDGDTLDAAWTSHGATVGISWTDGDGDRTGYEVDLTATQARALAHTLLAIAREMDEDAEPSKWDLAADDTVLISTTNSPW